MTGIWLLLFQWLRLVRTYLFILPTKIRKKMQLSIIMMLFYLNNAKFQPTAYFI